MPQHIALRVTSYISVAHRPVRTESLRPITDMLKQKPHLTRILGYLLVPVRTA